MASPRKPDRPSAWCTKQQMAAAFDVSETYFDREIRPLVPEKCVRHVGRRLRFYCRGVIDAWADAKKTHSNCDSDFSDLEAYLDQDFHSLRGILEVFPAAGSDDAHSRPDP